MLTGIWLRSTRSIVAKARGIAYAGCAGLLTGGLWNFTFPVNKKLWTSSYVLYAAGWSLLLLALSIYLIDIYGARRTDRPRQPTSTPRPAAATWSCSSSAPTPSPPTSYPSSSPELLYLFHPQPGVTFLRWFYESIVHVIPYEPIASMVFCILFAAVCWLPIYVLYRRRIFLKI